MVLITSSSPYTLKVGEKSPNFESLLGVDGELYALESFSKAEILVISFTCNHCPYAIAYEERFNQLAREFQARGIAFVAINSNDEKAFPEDSFEGMKTRALNRGFVFPYLQDKTQIVAKSFGAVCTPHIFVLDSGRFLIYEGRIDDNWRDEQAVTSHDLRDVLEATLDGQELPLRGNNPIGCSIKWKD